MAGYVFTVSKEGWSDFCENDLKYGHFTPLTPELSSDDTVAKKRTIIKTLSAIFGDMVTMSPGDNVYFLSNRKVYGIGRLVSIGKDCKYDNYLGASSLSPNPVIDPDSMLTPGTSRARWVLLFEHAPCFFKNGADMDDILRYRPGAFKMLRAFQGVSFIKIDDEENRALKEYISLINEDGYDDKKKIFAFSKELHEQLRDKDLSEYVMDINKALSDRDNKEYVVSEMFIEAALLQTLSKRSDTVFGHWDYLTQQLIASPFKPLDYIDKIDVYGYRFSTKYKEEPRLITKYLVIELKKGNINKAAVEQTMQYVDWVCREYAAGDYSKIKAYAVGTGAVKKINEIIEENCQRGFIARSHPAESVLWNDLTVIDYAITEEGVAFNKR